MIYFGSSFNELCCSKFILSSVSLYQSGYAVYGSVISLLIIKITIFSIVIGLKILLFSTNTTTCKVVIGQFVIGQFVIGQFNKPITFKVVVQIN